MPRSHKTNRMIATVQIMMFSFLFLFLFLRRLEGTALHFGHYAGALRAPMGCNPTVHWLGSSPHGVPPSRLRTIVASKEMNRMTIKGLRRGMACGLIVTMCALTMNA